MSWGKKDKNAADSDLSPEEMQVTPDGEIEPGQDEKGDAALSDKLKKLRAELEKCKEEKQEYLVGWQRCKADSINARKDAVLSAERAGNRARDALIEDIIPALDSFDMAIGSDAWAEMDSNWRTGMENVRSQLLGALLNQGVSAYADEGDAFDPILHDAVHEISEGGEEGIVAKVLRRGYRSAERIIRPAQVAVIAHKE
jgi:molecular chaperone GrpE